MFAVLFFGAALAGLWLWHPLRALGWPTYAALALVTCALGASPALLIGLMRQGSFSYNLIAHAQVVSGWLFASIACALLGAVLRDLLALALVLIAGAAGGRGGGAVAALWQPSLTVLGVGAALLLCAYGSVQGLRLPEIKERQIFLPNLPNELDGLRIAVLADLHASPINNARHIRAIVERTNAAKPDLIVLPGDLVDGDAETQAGNVSALAHLKAPYGVWAAPGNHEYYSGYLAWAREFERLGVRYLANEAQTIEVRGNQLVTISGVGDPAFYQSNHGGGERGGGVEPDIQAVADQVRAQQPSVLHILLGHQPKMARQYAAASVVDMQIAGHTHGGHILGVDRWVIAPFNGGFVRGEYQIEGEKPMRLFVSNGAGLWAGFTLRLGIPATIDILVLRKAGEKSAS